MASFKGALGLLAVLALLVLAVTLAERGLPMLRDPEPLILGFLERFDGPANPNDSSPREFEVRNGDSAADIAERLQASGIIREAMVFRLMADLGGKSRDLAAGDYDLAPSMRPSEILETIAGGRTRAAPQVTIPEGWRAEEIAERLASRGVAPVDQFMAVVRNGRSDLPLLASRPPGASLEGYLFPDTYSFDSKSTAESFVRQMLEQFSLRFDGDLAARAERLGVSVNDVVILASIIEREAVIPSERPLMAGVFYNRLREGIKLQSDPTVQYAVASAQPESRQRYGWWKSELTEQDLELDSPYNTYRYPGLPPGPICNPGLASLRAAAEPEVTDYLYFVAKPDGSHAFARTLEEHNENVARYR